jgi:AhpD family alkylhydroperoxidase
MHTKELRADGESEHRLYLLCTWRESQIAKSKGAAS